MRLFILCVLLGVVLRVVAQPPAPMLLTHTTPRFHYAGTVGTAPVQMELTFNAGTISGQYWYQRETTAFLPLSGILRENGAATLTEGRHGTFTGVFPPSRMSFAGQWTAGTRTLPVALHATATYNFMEETTKHATFTASYPVFVNPTPALRRLSASLKAGFASQRNQLLIEADRIVPANAAGWYQHYRYDIVYADPQVLSMLRTVDEYKGGAHPALAFMSLNYQLTANHTTPLKLSDLFTPGTEYMRALYAYTVNDVSRQRQARVQINTPIEGFKTDYLTVWTVTPSALIFTFDPGIAGAYYEGPYTTIIPFTTMRNYLNVNGPLGCFLTPASTG